MPTDNDDKQQTTKLEKQLHVVYIAIFLSNELHDKTRNDTIQIQLAIAGNTGYR
jgi:hypothetical protein